MTDLDTSQVLLLPKLFHYLHGPGLRKLKGKPGQGAVRVGVCPFALHQLGEFPLLGHRKVHLGAILGAAVMQARLAATRITEPVHVLEPTASPTRCCSGGAAVRRAGRRSSAMRVRAGRWP